VWLAERLPEAVLEDVRLLVSELVTGSLRHAGLAPRHWIGLCVDSEAQRTRVEVIDPGRGFDPDGADPADGWGLALVDRLAVRWGVERDEATRVWFELDHAPGRRPG
jgi:anti-sigma regulatory factor (Ser/Thr protein kinase)